MNAASIEGARLERATIVVLNEARDKGADSPVDYGDAEQIAKAVLGFSADELTALRAQVSQLTADLEVACGALEQTADALRRQHAVSPGHKDNAKWVGTALDHVRATLSAIRKDGP